MESANSSTPDSPAGSFTSALRSCARLGTSRWFVSVKGQAAYFSGDVLTFAGRSSGNCASCENHLWGWTKGLSLTCKRPRLKWCFLNTAGEIVKLDGKGTDSENFMLLKNTLFKKMNWWFSEVIELKKWKWKCNFSGRKHSRNKFWFELVYTHFPTFKLEEEYFNLILTFKNSPCHNLHSSCQITCS